MTAEQGLGRRALAPAEAASSVMSKSKPRPRTPSPNAAHLSHLPKRQKRRAVAYGRHLLGLLLSQLAARYELLDLLQGSTGGRESKDEVFNWPGWPRVAGTLCTSSLTLPLRWPTASLRVCITHGARCKLNRHRATQHADSPSAPCVWPFPCIALSCNSPKGSPTSMFSSLWGSM